MYMSRTICAFEKHERYEWEVVLKDRRGRFRQSMNRVRVGYVPTEGGRERAKRQRVETEGGGASGEREEIHTHTHTHKSRERDRRGGEREG